MESTVIWERVRDARKGPRPAHSLDDIAKAAIAIGDAEGISALSIRAIASALDAGAATLYRYISRKADVYDLMVDAVVAEFDLPHAPSGRWEADVALVAHRVRSAYRRHPWMAELAPYASWGPHTRDYMEFTLAALEPTGLGYSERVDVIGLMTAWIASFVRLESQPADEGAAVRLQYLASLATDAARPHLSQTLRTLMQADPSSSSPDQLFARGLERLLHGIGR